MNTLRIYLLKICVKNKKNEVSESTTLNRFEELPTSLQNKSSHRNFLIDLKKIENFQNPQ